MKTNKYPFEVAKNLFSIFPTGKLISKLEDQVVLEIMKVHNDYFLLTLVADPYQRLLLSGFNYLDYPGVMYTFLEPDGKEVVLEIKKNYFYKKEIVGEIND